MKVQSQNAQNLEAAQNLNQSKKTDRAAAAAKSKSASAPSGEASVNTNISSRAKEMAQAKSVAAQAPDVRDERVERLKKMIAEGKYKVDEKAIADKMVKEHLEA
jgi:negative regulator of flagellin synthesis FlgM